MAVVFLVGVNWGMEEENKLDIPEIPATVNTVTSVFANIFNLHPHEDYVLVDFGFVGPSYVEPYPLQDIQVSRIILTWDIAKQFADSVTKAHAEMQEAHKKNTTRKKSKK